MRSARAALLAAVLPAILGGQEFRATVMGRVVDASGAAVPNVTVVARNQATNESASAASGVQGSYTIPFLRPGAYDISAQVEGFKKFTRAGVVLSIGQTARVDIQQVTVTSEAPLLDTAKADHGTIVDNQRIREFPLVGRNALMLSRLVTGVSFNGLIQAQGTAEQGSIERWSINGSRQVPPVDSLEEFKIQTNSYDAQYGHTGGGIINPENALFGTLNKDTVATSSANVARTVQPGVKVIW